MKFPIRTLALDDSLASSSGPPALPMEPLRAGHSRTLYTSIALEQSNIIFKKWERRKNSAGPAKSASGKAAEVTSRLQDWP